MKNKEELLPRRLADYNAPVLEHEPPNIDRWLAASALQKAVRRGKREESLLCSRLLVTEDTQRIWRRLAVIAMEDVGVGDMEATAQTVWASRSKAWRGKHGGEWHVASYVVGTLCGALKSRDTDDLAAIASRHPDLAEERAELACAPRARLRDLLADQDQTPWLRSLAGWYLAGTDQYTAPHLPPRPGNLREVLEVYRHVGVPEYLLDVIAAGATKERGALPINLGLVWLKVAAARAVNCTRSRQDEPVEGDAADPPGTGAQSGLGEHRTPLTSLGEVNGVSSEAYDVHTRAGRRALAYLLRACGPVREYLSRFVPDREAFDLVAALVWCVEGALLDRRLVYDGSAEITEMAEVAEVAHGAFPAGRVPEAIDLMRRHLPDLHRARLRVVDTGRGQ